MKPCIALCTCADLAAANSIAEALVERKLAACVNLLPNLTSVYSWQGEICQDNEVQMVIKTSSEKVAKAAECVADMHPYDVPEWLVINVTEGSQAYLNWMRSCLE